MIQKQHRIKNPLLVRKIGTIDYQQCFSLMKATIMQGMPRHQHEAWFVEHPSVFTQGQAGKPEHLLSQSSIPCIQTDRGGQITYHGPGQLICYLLLDLHRLQLNIKQLVDKTTQSVIQVLTDLGIPATSNNQHPGIYVNNNKIASLGFRVRKHMSYHGVAINHAMDLSPFQLIRPCGRQQKIIQISELLTTTHIKSHQLQQLYIQQVAKTFAFDDVIITGCWPTHNATF